MGLLDQFFGNQSGLLSEDEKLLNQYYAPKARPSSGLRRQGNPTDAANLPVDVFRGRVAGLLGLVPDVLNFMGRSPMPTETFGETQYEPAPQLPFDTDYYLKNLPLAPTSRLGEVAGRAGSFVPLNPAPAARLTGRGVMAAGRAGERLAERVVPQIMERGGLPAEMLQGLAQGSRSNMIKTPLGQIPETASDVKKLGERFGRLLDDAGVNYSYDKSRLSPARYFTFDKPPGPTYTAEDIKKYGADPYKVRISDHKNVHGADFSVDPHTGATFEEMIESVRKLGVPIADKVLPKNTVVDQVRKLQNELLSGFDIYKIAAKNLPEGSSRAEIFAAAKPLESELYAIANLENSQINRNHLNRLKELLSYSHL